MPAPNPQNLFQSPPGSGGNDGAIPTTYDPKWPSYRNLTSDQVAAFQSFPQDLIRYVRVKRWQKEMALIDALRSPFDDGSSPVTLPPIGSLIPQLLQGIHATQTNLNQALTGINATPPTITTRAQIDAIIG